MKKRLLLAALAALSLLVVRGLVAEDAKEEKEFKATCPVSGQPAIEDSCVEYLGKKLYFCCENCPTAFEKDPEKFATKANYQLYQTGQIVLVACPITGKPVNPDTAIDVGDVKVCFCCNGCKGKVSKAEGDEQLGLVFADIEKGFTLQTECPVSGKPIDPSKSVEYKGKKVYFCCGNCPKAFEKDPEKFADKLPQLAEEKE